MRLLIGVFFFFCLTKGFAQRDIQGIVKDAQGKPVEFVSIILNASSLGTVTNEEGKFTIPVPALPSTLNVKHIAYQPRVIQINDDKMLEITLIPQIVELREVTVGDPALSLIINASEKAEKTLTNPNYMKAFSRQVMYQGSEPVFIGENFIDAQWQNWGINKFNTTNARYLYRPKAVNYTNITMLSYLNSGFWGNTQMLTPISHRPDSLYRFSISRNFTNEGRDIAVVTCVLKDDKHLSQSAFIGDIYIDTESYDVVRMDGTLAHFKLNMNFGLSIKLTKLRLLTSYRLNKQGINVLDYSSYSIDSEVKALGLGIKKLSYNSRIYIVDDKPGIDPSSLHDLSFGTKENDVDRVKRVIYDDNFWLRNPVVKRTAAEETAISTLGSQSNRSGTMKTEGK